MLDEWTSYDTAAMNLRANEQAGAGAEQAPTASEMGDLYNTGCHHLQEAMDDMKRHGYDPKDLDPRNLKNAIGVVHSGTSMGAEASIRGRDRSQGVRPPSSNKDQYFNDTSSSSQPTESHSGRK